MSQVTVFFGIDPQRGYVIDLLATDVPPPRCARQLMCVRLTGQSVDGHVVVGRVANVSIFVSGRDLQASHTVLMFPPSCRALPVKILEDVHHLGSMFATGRLVGRQV